MQNKIMIGILGCGNVVRKHAISAFRELDIAELKGIGSRDKDKAKTWAKEFSIPFSGDYEEIINNPEIDSVYIALPTKFNEEWIIKAANAGKHVICEKSISDNYNSVLRIVEACKKNKVVLFENFMCAYHPQHQIIKQMIKKELGEVFTFTGYFGAPHLNKENFRYDIKLGGGCLNDMGAYLVFMSRMILEEEPSALTCSLDFSPDFSADIQGSALLEFPNRKSALVSFGFGRVYQNNYSIWGSQGVIKTNRAYSIPKNMKPEITLIKNENMQEVTNKIELESVNQFKEGFKAFCRTILENNKKFKNRQYEEIVQQARIMQVMRDSARNKMRIEIERT